MTEREALLAAVLAHRDDDTPRLVYADWLDDHGDAARAEFIRLQVARARTGVGTATGEREQTLLQAHWRAWLPREVITWRWRRPTPSVLLSPTPPAVVLVFKPGLGLFAVVMLWTRGFASTLSCPWKWWRRCHAGLTSAHPIETVHNTTGANPPSREYLRQTWPRVEFPLGGAGGPEPG